MLKKIFVKEGFSYNGERFVKGTIASIDATAIEKLAKEGFIEDVATALGLDTSCDTDLSNYVQKSEIEDLRGKDGIDGKDGKDGYPTKEQWTSLLAEVSTLTAEVTTLKEKVATLESQKEEQPVNLGAKATTKSKAKKA